MNEKTLLQMFLVLVVVSEIGTIIYQCPMVEWSFIQRIEATRVSIQQSSVESLLLLDGSFQINTILLKPI